MPDAKLEPTQLDVMLPRNVVFEIEPKTQAVTLSNKDNPVLQGDLFAIATFCILVLEDLTGQTSVNIIDHMSALTRRFHKDKAMNVTKLN